MLALFPRFPIFPFLKKSFKVLPSLCFHLWLYFLYLAVGHHQHPQGPQSGERSGTNLTQIVSPQLQQPRAMWEAPGNMLKPTGATVHQVTMLITDALKRTQPRTLG